jgi:large subunit ribosomal protein L21
MYAIIRAGGKQAKVQSGDVIEIERLKGDDTEITFEPLLVVDDEGNAVSDHKALAKAKVSAKVLGETQGDKIDIFKYKNKSGYRRRQGHRQKYTRIEITGINLPGSKTEAKKTEAKKPAAKKTEAKKPAAKKTEAKKPEAKKPEAKKPAAKKTEAKKPAAKPAATKAKSSASEEE